MRSCRLTTVCTSALLSAGLTVPALAQIDEILVTATKREQSLQDVPIAVSAYNSVQLDRAGVKTIRDLPLLSPSFTMNSSQTESQGTTLRLRGVGTTGNNIGLESAVGVFIDGVYQSRPGVALGELVNVEAIEVLRGPQGTLFGRNTSAGALVVRTKRASLEETDAFANISFGNFEEKSVQLGVSTPIIENELAVGATFAWRDRNGFVTSAAADDGVPNEAQSDLGSDSYTRDRIYMRGEIVWEPNDAVDIRLIGDYAEADEFCCDGITFAESPLAFLPGGHRDPVYGFPGNGGVYLTGADALRERSSNSNDGGFFNPFEQWGVQGEINWDLDFGKFTYIGSYRDFGTGGGFQGDFAAADVYTVEDLTGDAVRPGGDFIDTTTHEVRFAGTWEWLDWMVGAYYAYEEIEETFTLGLQRDYGTYVVDANLQAPGTNAAIEAAASGFFGTPVTIAGSFGNNFFLQESTSWSIFTHNTIDLTDRFTLTLGARYVNEKKDAVYEQLAGSNPVCNFARITASALAGFYCFPFAAEANGDVAATLGNPVEFDDRFKDDEITYVVSLGYDVNEDINVYFTHSHGFKAGGFNLDATAAAAGADPRFSSELTDSYEVGLKGQFFNDHVRANIALFRMDMEDFQVLEFTGIQFQTFNVPKAKSQGVEVELVEAFDGLNGGKFTLTQSLTYADSRYPKDCDNNNLNHIQDVLAGSGSPVSALCGFRLTNASLWTGVIGGTFEMPINNKFMMFINGSVRLESKRRTSTQAIEPGGLAAPGVLLPGTGFNNIGDYQGANAKLNGRIGFGDIDNLWAIEIWGTNILDYQTRNVTYNQPLRGSNALCAQCSARGAFLEAPRTFGATLRVKY